MSIGMLTSSVLMPNLFGQRDKLGDIDGMLASPGTAQRDKFGDIECTSLTVVDGGMSVSRAKMGHYRRWRSVSMKTAGVSMSWAKAKDRRSCVLTNMATVQSAHGIRTDIGSNRQKGEKS